jgi:hypothetical protein
MPCTMHKPVCRCVSLEVALEREGKCKYGCWLHLVCFLHCEAQGFSLSGQGVVQWSWPFCLFTIISSRSIPHDAACCYNMNIINAAGTQVGTLHVWKWLEQQTDRFNEPQTGGGGVLGASPSKWLGPQGCPGRIPLRIWGADRATLSEGMPLKSPACH